MNTKIEMEMETEMETETEKESTETQPLILDGASVVLHQIIFIPTQRTCLEYASAAWTISRTMGNNDRNVLRIYCPRLCSEANAASMEIRSSST